jgi:hypothetical protein
MANDRFIALTSPSLSLDRFTTFTWTLVFSSRANKLLKISTLILDWMAGSDLKSYVSSASPSIPSSYRPKGQKHEHFVSERAFFLPTLFVLPQFLALCSMVAPCRYAILNLTHPASLEGEDLL